MTWQPEPYRLTSMDDARVCWTHGRVNVCRVGLYQTGVEACQWRYDAPSVVAVVEYQTNLRRDWKE